MSPQIGRERDSFCSKKIFRATAAGLSSLPRGVVMSEQCGPFIAMLVATQLVRSYPRLPLARCFHIICCPKVDLSSLPGRGVVNVMRMTLSVSSKAIEAGSG